MLLLRHMSRLPQYVCRDCVRQQHTLHSKLSSQLRPKIGWAAEEQDVGVRDAAWQDQAGRIKAGAQQSMLSVLEDRGFVKDVAG